MPAMARNHSGASILSTTTWAMVAAKMTVTTGLVAALNVSPIFIVLCQLQPRSERL